MSLNKLSYSPSCGVFRDGSKLNYNFLQQYKAEGLFFKTIHELYRYKVTKRSRDCAFENAILGSSRTNSTRHNHMQNIAESTGSYKKFHKIYATIFSYVSHSVSVRFVLHKYYRKQNKLDRFNSGSCLAFKFAEATALCHALMK